MVMYKGKTYMVEKEFRLDFHRLVLSMDEAACRHFLLLHAVRV